MDSRKYNSIAFILGFLLVFLLGMIFSSDSYAQTPWPDRSYPQPKVEAGKISKDIASAPKFVFDLNNLSGDFGVIYGPNRTSGVAAMGIGLDVVNYDQGLAVLRAEAFIPSLRVLGQGSATVLGASVMVNLIKLVGMVPNTTWLATAINPSIGVFVGYDFEHGGMVAGPMISIINIPF